jgi:hypothetical protein
MTDEAVTLPTRNVTEDEFSAMVEKAVNAATERVTDTLNNALATFEQRIKAEYVSREEYNKTRRLAAALKRSKAAKFVEREEYDTLVGRFNAYPTMPANLSDIEHVHRELDKVKAENDLLKSQVGQAIGGQAAIRESVMNMRATAESVERQGIQMDTTSRLLMSALQDNRATMQTIHKEQETARAERIEARQRVDNLSEIVNRTEDWIIDSDKRNELAITPLRDYVMGSGTQPGIPKMFSEVQKAIAEFRDQYQKDRATDQPILDRAKKGQQLQSGAFRFVWNVVFTKEFLGVLAAGGSIGAAILAVFGQQ